MTHREWIAEVRDRVSPRMILFAAWCFTIAYAFPGYMNWDSGDQIYQARTGFLEDWHPPIMAFYWGLFDRVVSGPFLMLVLQSLLFTWGMYGLLRRRFTPRLAACLAAGLLVFPPILTPMAVVWKDAQMAGFLVAGTALVLSEQRWMRVLAVILLVFATGVRDNGIAAIPPIALLATASWGIRRKKLAAIGLIAIIAVIASIANTVPRDHRQRAWYKTVAIHDIAGTICHADPLTDDQVHELLDGVPLWYEHALQYRMCKAYTPRVWFQLSYGDDLALFRVRPNKEDRLGRRAAWFRLVREHPHAFLTHRMNIMKELLGLTEDEPWEPVCQTIGANPAHLTRISHDHALSGFQTMLGTWFRESWARTLFYRPWAYALVALVLLGYAIRRRDALLMALLGSGLLYEASMFIGAAAPDFRYSHWMIACTMIASVVIFAERLRAGLALRGRAK